MSASIDHTPASRPRPGWLLELLEVLELRRRTLLLAVGGVAVAGLLAALLMPAFLPPRPEVGAAVGLAAVLLGVAITFGLDSLDLKVRGPRHVRSSGGLLAQQLAGEPSSSALTRLVTPLAARARADGRVLLGLSPIDADLDAEGWQDALASALADDGLRVLTVDLQRPAETHPGVVEVTEGSSSLADAVTFDGERMVARLGPGRDPAAALGGLRMVVERLPSDIDVLVVLLPPPSGGGVLGAAAVLDHVYLLAEVDRTARVDLIAALDAFDAVQAASEVLLVTPAVDTGAAAEAAPALEPAEPVSGDEPDAETGDEAAPDEPSAVEEPAGVAQPSAFQEPPASEEPSELEEPPAVEQPTPAAATSDDPHDVGPEPPPVVAEPRGDDPQLRLMIAEAALELTGLSGSDLPPATVEAEDEAPSAEVPGEDDPTLETPPVVLDDAEVHHPGPTDEPADPEEQQVASGSGEPDEADRLAPDLPEDPARVAAVLHGLGPELWSPAQPRVPTGPRG